MHRIFVGLFWLLLAAYVAALLLFAIGLFGLFGQARDPLAAVFLLPLGLPWTLLADVLPVWAGRWLVVLAPLLNLLILRWLVIRTAPTLR